MSGSSDAAVATTTFTLNGEVRTVHAPAEAPLLLVLRNDLGLVGSRYGCGVGQCGACRVIVDGVARSSCDLRLADVRGRTVRTVEGLAVDGRLDAVQDAIVELGAGQCGYCLSGIIMSARALLDTTPDPSDLEVRAALEPNLCRCGIHDRLLRAVHLAAARERARP